MITAYKNVQRKMKNLTGTFVCDMVISDWANYAQKPVSTGFLAYLPGVEKVPMPSEMAAFAFTPPESVALARQPQVSPGTDALLDSRAMSHQGLRLFLMWGLSPGFIPVPWGTPLLVLKGTMKKIY